ncbi:uncharacterized protein LOC144111126 [Amblyomma americanum]
MAMHEPHHGRQCRSVSFDDGQRRVIATDLDPEVDPAKLKSIVGRPPTPRPSRTDCTASSSPAGDWDELGEDSSRPPSAASEAGVSATIAAQQPDKSLDLELLMRLTLERDGLADKEWTAAEPALRRERGEGPTDDKRDVDQPATEDLTSEDGGSA